MKDGKDGKDGKDAAAAKVCLSFLYSFIHIGTTNRLFREEFWIPCETSLNHFVRCIEDLP